MVGKIYAGILVDIVRRVTGDSIDDEQVYVGFIDLEKVYVRVNREALWQVLRMYNGINCEVELIKSMYVDILACVRVNGVKMSGLG